MMRNTPTKKMTAALLAVLDKKMRILPRSQQREIQRDILQVIQEHLKDVKDYERRAARHEAAKAIYALNKQ